MSEQDELDELDEHISAALDHWDETYDNDSVPWVRAIVNAVLSSPWMTAHDAEVAAKALEDAADAVRDEMRDAELGITRAPYEDALPKLSRVMLNGGTRFAKRLRARAGRIREGE